MSQEAIRKTVIEEVIKPMLPSHMLAEARYLVNPTGRFVIGGLQDDCDLTGRKIIADAYGGAAPHDGGASSGKDPSKIDRSAACTVRYVAKNVIIVGLTCQCQVQVSYAIGVAYPINITVYTESTGVVPDRQIAKLVQKHFNLRPKGIVQVLDLLRSIYEKTAAYGRFSHGEPEFSWETTDKVLLLCETAGLTDEPAKAFTWGHLAADKKSSLGAVFCCVFGNTALTVPC